MWMKAPAGILAEQEKETGSDPVKMQGKNPNGPSTKSCGLLTTSGSVTVMFAVAFKAVNA